MARPTPPADAPALPAAARPAPPAASSDGDTQPAGALFGGLAGAHALGGARPTQGDGDTQPASPTLAMLVRGRPAGDRDTAPNDALGDEDTQLAARDSLAGIDTIPDPEDTLISAGETAPSMPRVTAQRVSPPAPRPPAPPPPRATPPAGSPVSQRITPPAGAPRITPPAFAETAPNPRITPSSIDIPVITDEADDAGSSFEAVTVSAALPLPAEAFPTSPALPSAIQALAQQHHGLRSGPSDASPARRVQTLVGVTPPSRPATPHGMPAAVPHSFPPVGPSLLPQPPLPDNTPLPSRTPHGIPLPAAPDAPLSTPALVPAAAPAGRRTRVTVANRGGGGVFYWLARLYAFSLLSLVALLVVGAFGIYSYFSINAPSVPDLERYTTVTSAGVSRVLAADGTIIGQYAKEWRELVPFERMPPQLVNAFLAVEDHEFFQHKGIYFKGIVRAAWRNVTAGDFTQGGSTITQQVAKQFLGSEKSLSRKGKEAVVARRLEARYSKRAILSVYLNHIYLGAGAWGVSAAAKRYFDKELRELTLAESALVAGLAQAPSRFSPQNQPKLAIERRNVVLDKMATYGFATADEVAKAKTEPIRLDMNYNTAYADRMPYYGTFVRNSIAARLGDEVIRLRGLQVPADKLADERRRLGEEALSERGLRIETAAEPAWEAAAYENADYGAHNQDKRQGWRGPEWRVDGPARELFLSRQKQLYGAAPLVPGKRYLALVDKVSPGGAEVLIGERRFQLPLRNMQWASKWQSGNADNDIPVESATAALRPGYVVWVRREQRTVTPFRTYSSTGGNPVWIPASDQRTWDDANTEVVRLEQVPHPQTAIFTADHRTAYVTTMVGGYDYDRSVFNRSVQACRQPGSTYKPIYYSLALDQGYGFDTRLNDIPITLIDPETGEKWTPTNLDDTLDSDVTLEFALVFSKNVPSLDLFLRLKAPNVEAWARRLGFTTKIFADEALALGASCSKLDELSRAFTMFARNGAWWPRPEGREKSWVYVRRILDREGNTLEDDTVAEDPQLPAADRLDRVAALAGLQAKQAIPARAAYLMSKLLANEVTYGFASVLRETKIPSAGKTGTSSDTHDTTFVAYTSQFTTLVWMGDDKKERALGRKDAAYITVVPLWSRYMYEASKGYPNKQIPWQVPPGVKPDDRGDHTKGERVPQMDLIWKLPEKPSETEGDDRPPV